MNAPVFKTETNYPPFSEARQRLLALCRDIHFGRIGAFDIRDGEPVFEPAPNIVREIKFNGEHAVPAKHNGEIPLRKQSTELFAWFDRLQNARVCYLEVKHGLPFKMNVLHDPCQLKQR
jgi:hypothetical protein